MPNVFSSKAFLPASARATGVAVAAAMGIGAAALSGAAAHAKSIHAAPPHSWLNACAAGFLAEVHCAPVEPASYAPHDLGQLEAVQSWLRKVLGMGAVERGDLWGHGADCEEWALLGREVLHQLGYPRSSLYIADGWRRDGVRHAWLVVRTNGGDFALDINEARVVPANNLPYDVRAMCSGPEIGACYRM